MGKTPKRCVWQARTLLGDVKGDANTHGAGRAKSSPHCPLWHAEARVPLLCDNTKCWQPSSGFPLPRDCEWFEVKFVKNVLTRYMHLQQAGSTTVFELHGNMVTSTCRMCREKVDTSSVIIQLQDKVHCTHISDQLIPPSLYVLSILLNRAYSVDHRACMSQSLKHMANLR